MAGVMPHNYSFPIIRLIRSRAFIVSNVRSREFCIRILAVLVLSLAVLPLQADPSPGEQQVSAFLNQTVGWYRHLAIEREIATTPTDMVFFDDDAHLAPQVVQMAFDFARSEEQLFKQNKGQGTEASRYQALNNASQKLDDEVQQTQTKIDSLRHEISVAAPRRRKTLEATLSDTESQLQLLQARRDVVHAMQQFVGTSAASGSPTGLAAQIEALSHSVPAAISAPSNSGKIEELPAVSAPASANKAEPSGLWGQVTALISSSRRKALLDDDIAQTNATLASCKNLQKPLLDKLKQMAQQSDAIAGQTNSGSQSTLVQDKGQLDALTAQFKALSGSFVPLSKQAILLGVYLNNLYSWEKALNAQYIAQWKNLLIRLGGLAVVLAILFGFSRLWRRAIFRYVHDARRRYQMLLARRIVVWVVAILVIAFAFASELGSVATFAGLITAGVAVALQNVILSIAGYFFLIGKFGVRVGDRVQISGVTGEVVDIGLVRMHVMELGGYGRDLQPTGRVVAFSNSVVFQSGAGIFRQIPGTNFVWHEMTLTLAFEGDYRTAEQRMIRAIDKAFASYSQHFEHQRQLIESNLSSVSIGTLRPRTSFRLTSAGLEVKISFPVEVEKSGDMDARVTDEILRELDRDPKLKMVGSDIPTIREMNQAPSTAKAS